MSLPQGGLVPVKPGSARGSSAHHHHGMIGVNSNSTNVAAMGSSQNPSNGVSSSSHHQQQQSPRANQHSSRGNRPSHDGDGGHLPSTTSGVSRVPDERLLSIYEREELRNFDHGIYYYGENCASKIQAPTTGANYGFDDERGDYQLVTGDHIRFRYVK